jgi:hypothetical protein
MSPNKNENDELRNFSNNHNFFQNINEDELESRLSFNQFCTFSDIRKFCLIFGYFRSSD